MISIRQLKTAFTERRLKYLVRKYYRVNKLFKSLLLLFFLAIGSSIALREISKNKNESDKNEIRNEPTTFPKFPPDNENTSSPEDLLNTTFQVIVPKVTPSLDPIFIHFGLQSFRMRPLGNLTYQFVLDPTVLRLGKGAEISYAYSRGGLNIFGEMNFTNNQPRSFIIGSSKLVTDIVEEWKWLPNNRTEPSIPTLSDNFSIASRQSFWKGVHFVDFWSDMFESQFETTIAHLKSLGYEWIFLSPPWEIISEDPPIISGNKSLTKTPVFTDAALRNHIRVFREAGFKVGLRIQVCCETIDTTNRSATWWEQWFGQLKGFVEYHANVSREEDVSALVLTTPNFGAGLPLNYDVPSQINATKNWLEIIDAARLSNAKIGIELFGKSFYEDPNSLPWPGEQINFFNQLDFASVSLWGAIVNVTNPSQSDFDNGTALIFKNLDYLYNKTNLPILIQSVAYASLDGSGLEKGPETTYTWEDPRTLNVTIDEIEQAMIYESIMKQVATRDYIMGLFPFGYWYLDGPSTPDTSIRAKLAETILISWLTRFPNTTDVRLTKYDAILLGSSPENRISYTREIIQEKTMSFLVLYFKQGVAVELRVSNTPRVLSQRHVLKKSSRSIWG